MDKLDAKRLLNDYRWPMDGVADGWYGDGVKKLKFSLKRLPFKAFIQLAFSSRSSNIQVCFRHFELPTLEASRSAV